MIFEQWMKFVLDTVEYELSRFLPQESTEPKRLHEAMRYAVLHGGKRVRPMLCYATGEISGAPINSLNAAAVALEMIHVYSLVHDDIPYMDNDMLRRGKPAVHVQYDVQTALLVGNALQSQAFMVLTDNTLDPACQAMLVRELALASGSLGMIGGQAIDIESIGLELSHEHIKKMHHMKTGKLLRAAVRMGILASGIDKLSDAEMQSLDEYANAVGLAFQIVDDILDITTGSIILGKTPGKDAENNKPTYVEIFGLDASRELVTQLHTKAYTAITPFGMNAKYLRELADLIVNRVS
ncbi:MAG: polyprenyl synthetase family protein [Burkholderia sp.]|nr:polyprenyl synthetase family protein [Burkholderia sp.]